MQVDRLEQDSAAGAEYKDFRIEKDRKL
jgi:hypothetical protein